MGDKVIRSVVIKNFQSHKESTLEFSRYVNSIAAPSNSGKTAILRAINWVVNNRPTGQSMISHWALDKKNNQKDETSVTIVTHEHTISRIKNKTENIYVLDGIKLESVGMDVPPEITRAINMSSVNIQQQLDAPFLLSESPGEVARFFNRIVQLDQIDAYLSSIEAKKRKTRSEIELDKTNLKSINQDIEKYAWLDRAELLITKITELEQRQQQLLNAKGNLNETVATYTQMIQRIDAIQKVLKPAITLVNSLSDKLPKYAAGIAQLNIINDSLDRYHQNQNLLDNQVDTVYAEKLIKRIDKFIAMKHDAEHQYHTIAETIAAYHTSKEVVATFDATFQNLQKELPKECPLCGSLLDHDHPNGSIGV